MRVLALLSSLFLLVGCASTSYRSEERRYIYSGFHKGTPFVGRCGLRRPVGPFLGQATELFPTGTEGRRLATQARGRATRSTILSGVSLGMLGVGVLLVSADFNEGQESPGGRFIDASLETEGAVGIGLAVGSLIPSIISAVDRVKAGALLSDAVGFENDRVKDRTDEQVCAAFTDG